MNIKMPYELSVNMVRELGIDKFIEMLEGVHGFNFFSCSIAWLEDSSFICKLKGTKGDLIIEWE